MHEDEELIIPAEWHSEYQFSCLTESQFKLLREKYEYGDSFYCDCEECGTYMLGRSHRCSCGSRRCYFYFDVGMGELSVSCG